jgi:hypothetical protein
MRLPKWLIFFSKQAEPSRQYLVALFIADRSPAVFLYATENNETSISAFLVTLSLRGFRTA